MYALRKLLESLGPIIGAELESGKAVTPGWADGVHKGQMITWGAEAQELQDDLEAHIMETFTTEYTRLMRQVISSRLTSDAHSDTASTSVAIGFEDNPVR